jgi:hypothetical protein
MTQDEIIEMAEHCGFTRTHTGDVILWLCNKKNIEKLIKLAEFNEREACAKICDKEVEDWKYDADVVDVSIAIRARGTHENN